MKTNNLRVLALAAAIPTIATAGTTKWTGNISTVGAPSASGSGTVNASTSSKTKNSVQNAIDSASSNNKKTAKAGSGTWKFGGSLTPASDVNIYGNGVSSTLIRRNGGSNSGSFTTGLIYLSNGASGREDIEIRNIKFDGWYSTSFLASNTCCNAIYITSNSSSNVNNRIRVRDCQVKRAENGILLGSCRDFTIMGTEIFETGRTGIHHQVYTRRMGEFLFQDVNFRNSLNNGGNGAKVTGGTFGNGSWESKTIWVTGCSMNSNARTGFNSNGNGYQRIYNSDFNDNKGTSSNEAGIFFGTQSGNTCYRTDVYNCDIKNNDAYGIGAESTDRVWVDDNVISGNDDGDFNLIGSHTRWEDDE